MAEIQLVRQQAIEIPEKDREAARNVLFGIVDGLGDRGKKQWRRFVNGLMRLEPGEIVTIRTHKPRSLPFHNRHMAIEQRVFEAQERFESFEQFRNWLKIGSGFCDWCAGPKGGVIPLPKSIAFDELEDDDMREVHEDMVAFLRSHHATRYLWRHLAEPARTEMIETILAEFDE